MPYSRPSLSTLRSNARNQLQTSVNGSQPYLRNSVLSYLADVIAGVIYSEYGYNDWICQQLFPDTAESDYLARWAAIYGLSRTAASSAEGNVVFQGTPGTAISPGLLVQDAAGNQFETTAGGTISNSSTITLPVLAIVPGSASNEAASTPVTLVTAVSGVVGTATFDANGATGGADQEDDSSLRVRVLDRIQEPPQGGSGSDYVEWVLSQPGVTRAWVFPLLRGAGTVDVTWVYDDRTNIIPTADDVAAVQTYLDTVRPVTADVLAWAGVATPVNITLSALSPNNATVQAAVTASISDMLLRNAAPGGTIYFSQIIDAIMQAEGVVYCDVCSPSGDLTLASNAIAQVGTISFPS